MQNLEVLRLKAIYDEESSLSFLKRRFVIVVSQKSRDKIQYIKSKLMYR